MRFAFPKTVNSLEDFDSYSPRRMSTKMTLAAQDVFKWIYVRSRLSEAQNHRCCWCRCLTTEERNKKNSSTVEHIKPRCEGGTDDIENLLMACHQCNQKRKTHPWELFLLHIEEGIVLPKCKVKTPVQPLPQREKKLVILPPVVAKVNWFAYPSKNKGLKVRTQQMMNQLKNNPQLIWC